MAGKQSTAQGTKKASPKQGHAPKSETKQNKKTVTDTGSKVKEEKNKTVSAGEHAQTTQSKQQTADTNTVLEAELIMNEHSEEVRSMFKKITKHYDLLNHVCSLGLDFWWRKVLVDSFVLGSTNKILDMAAGTLDVSLTALKKYKHVSLVAGDICPEMLERGKEKLKAGDRERIELATIDALAIPYPENSFDVVCMAFGIRNIEDKITALREMKKVLAIGGQVHILEFSPVENHFLQKAYYFYLEKVMPAFAKLIGENTEAYAYLAKSIENFPSRDEFCVELRKAGFDLVNYKKLSFGIVTIYTAIKSK